MKRKFLFSFYETPQGKLLQLLENRYLKSSIMVSCKQTIMQIGCLKWESDFIDCSLYKNFSIIDAKGGGSQQAIKIRGMSHSLPIQSEMVDLVILPHLLEFDANRFHTMREIERILKPGGEVLILNFNLLNIWVRLQFIWNIKMSNSWYGYFITRSRISDWLKLLNFEIMSTSEFTIDSIVTTPDDFKFGKRTFYAMAYAVRAVKREYTLIPLTPVKTKPAQLVSVSTGLKASIKREKQHD